MVVYGTLCHIMNDRKFLMLRKATGLFGGGKWNGLGGKIGVGESPEQACIREVLEESGLKVSNLRYHGVLKFWFGDAGETIVVHVFSTHSFEGRIKEGREGILRWIDFDEIPYEEMWQDDRYWLPALMEGKNFKGEFHFNEQGNMILRQKLEVF